MTSAPLPFRWLGDSMEILPRFAKAADAAFVVGQIYRLEAIEDRSGVSHRHYFAQIRECWLNLPEGIADEYPSETALRKRALIRCGFADSRQFVASSKAEALRLAAFMKPMDEYALVSVRDCVVTVWTARSQDTKSMGRKEFQDSKQKVLDWVSALIGVEPKQLEREAGKAA